MSKALYLGEQHVSLSWCLTGLFALEVDMHACRHSQQQQQRSSLRVALGQLSSLFGELLCSQKEAKVIYNPIQVQTEYNPDHNLTERRKNVGQE